MNPHNDENPDWNWSTDQSRVAMMGLNPQSQIREEKPPESCSEWLRYCLFAANIIFLMVGTMVLALGAWLRTDSRFRDFLSERYRQIVQEAFWEAPTLYIFSYILIVLGGLMVVIAMFGCCGAVQRSKMILGIYATFLFIVMLCTLGCGIFIMYKRDGIDVELQDALNYMVQHYYQGAGIIQESLDRLQQAFRCCGNAGCADFAAFHQDVPRTCDIRCDGCHFRIWTALHIGFSIAVVVFLVVIVAQVIKRSYYGLQICLAASCGHVHLYYRRCS
ncbi:hypothetical protein L596_004039 [Steinernema carpocapsae]|uniref:Uncharacterized protein n=1 Tax=Steinernema carpocapsae TaxID=34508 RepID=A0A4U8UYL3_STECR|nr:hypothetical protein L596_004039 [Steinernema carpocapsae]